MIQSTTTTTMTNRSDTLSWCQRVVRISRNRENLTVIQSTTTTTTTNRSVSMFKSLYNQLPSSTTVNSAVCLLDCNKQEIKQLGTCHVSVKFRSTVKCVHFYIVRDRLKPIIGVSDALALGLTSFHCPIFNYWQSNCDLTNSVDSIHSNANSTEIQAQA